MFRLSVTLVAALTLVGATAISFSPASALSGSAYDKCMAKCMKSSPTGKRCPAYCDKYNR
jgi:hypothetical protein